MGQKDGSVSFYQNWNVYRRGFGVPSTNNFWVGLDTIKRLTDIGRLIANDFPRFSFVWSKLATVYEVCHIRYKSMGTIMKAVTFVVCNA